MAASMAKPSAKLSHVGSFQDPLQSSQRSRGYVLCFLRAPAWLSNTRPFISGFCHLIEHGIFQRMSPRCFSANHRKFIKIRRSQGTGILEDDFPAHLLEQQLYVAARLVGVDHSMRLRI